MEDKIYISMDEEDSKKEYSSKDIVDNEDLDITLDWSIRPSATPVDFSIENELTIETRSISLDSYDSNDTEKNSIIAMLMTGQYNESDDTDNSRNTGNNDVNNTSALTLDTGCTTFDGGANSSDGLTTPKEGYSYMKMFKNAPFKPKVTASQVLEISKQSEVIEDKVVGIKRIYSEDSKENSKQSKSSYDTLQTTSIDTSRFVTEFYPMKTIGKGVFGLVYIVKRYDTLEQYAIKKSIRPFKSNSNIDRNYILNEVKVVTELSNDSTEFKECVSIVKYYSAWIEDDYVYLQMEVCDDSVESMIVNKHIFSFNEIIKILHDMLIALDIIHRNNYVHLDVKPGNILKKSSHYKLSDFGLATHITNGKATTKDSGEEGDCRYMAKELLDWTPVNDLRKCDMFSLGITIYELVTGIDMPLNGSLWLSLRDNTYEINPNPNITLYNNELNILIRLLMDKTPSNRPSANECLINYNNLFDNQIKEVTSLGNQLESVSMTSEFNK